MDINEIRRNVADNIAALRSDKGLTQAQLAEKLNYTDKAISKWERAESVPDIATLKEVADMFGVSVDWLITEHRDDVPRTDKEVIIAKKHNKLQITLLSVVGVWFVATAFFVCLMGAEVPHYWLPFLWAVPATAIDLLVFNAIWGRYEWNFLMISLIIWTVPAAVYVTVATLTGNWGIWYLFFFAIPLQVATFFWSQIKVAISPGARKTK